MRELKNEYERHQEKKGKEGKKWKEKKFHLFLKIISYWNFSDNISSTRDQALLSIIYIPRYILVFIIKVKNNLSCRQKYILSFLYPLTNFFFFTMALSLLDERNLAGNVANEWKQQLICFRRIFQRGCLSNQQMLPCNPMWMAFLTNFTNITLRSSRVSWRKIRPKFVHHLDILQAC